MAAGTPYMLSRRGHSHSWCSLKTCLLSVSNPRHGLEEDAGHAPPGARPRVGWGPTQSPAPELWRGSGKSVPGPFPPKRFLEELGQDRAALGPTLAAGTAHPQS